MVTLSVTQGDIAAADVDAIVVNLFEGITSPGGGTGAVDRALSGAIPAVIADGQISGKPGENATVHPPSKPPPQPLRIRSG